MLLISWASVVAASVQLHAPPQLFSNEYVDGQIRDLKLKESTWPRINIELWTQQLEMLPESDNPTPLERVSYRSKTTSIYLIPEDPLKLLVYRTRCHQDGVINPSLRDF